MKRFLSFLLALNMLISLFPAVSAEGEKNNISMTYDISNLINGVAYTAANGSTFAGCLNHETTKTLFRYVRSSKTNTKQAMDVIGDEVTGTTSTEKLMFAGGVGKGYIRLWDAHYICFEIFVPKDGDYTLNVKHQLAKVGAKTVNVHFTKAEDFYALEPISTAKVRDDKVLGEPVGSYDCQTGYVKNGFESKQPWYDTDIKKTLSAGKYIITFQAVGGQGSVGTFTLTAGDGTEKMLIGAIITGFEDDKVNLKAYMTNGEEADLTGAAIEYMSSDESVVSVDKATGKLEILQKGKSTISAKVTLDGITVTTEKELDVSDMGTTVFYDVSKHLIDNAFGWASRPAFSTLDYIATHGFFDVVESSSNELDNNKIGVAGSEKRFLRLKKGNYISFEVNVPAKGMYTLYADYQQGKSGGNMNVYVTDKETYDRQESFELSNLGNIGTDSYSCKSADDQSFGAANTNWMLKKPVASKLELSEGKYVITFYAENEATISSFYLISGAGRGTALMSAEVKTSRNLAELFAYMSDGEVRSLRDLDVTYTSENTDIAEIDPKNGVITDKAYGKVKIFAECEFDGKTVLAEGIYTALDPNARGIEINVDIGDALVANEIATDGKVGFGAINFDTTKGIYRFFKGSYDKYKESRITIGTKNFGIRHNHYLAFEVLIPEPGIYTMEMWPSENSAMVPINVFMAKGSVSTKEEDFIGSYESRNAEIAYNPNYFKNIVKEPFYIENIVVEEPGYYVFNFRGDASKYAETDASYSYRYGSVGTFCLYSSDKAVMMGAIPAENEEDVRYISGYPDETTVSYTDPVERGRTNFNVHLKTLDGEVAGSVDSASFILSDESIATVNGDGVIHAIGDGDFAVTATALLGGKTYTGTVNMNAYDDTGVAESEFIIPEKMYVRGTEKTTLAAFMNSGNRAVVPQSVEKTYAYEPEGVVNVDEKGIITALSEGEATVTASAFYKGSEVKASATVTVTLDDVKTEPSYYTYEKRAIVQENIAKYSWAKDIKKSAEASAAKYLANYEFLYNHLPREGIPRTRYVSHQNDSNYKYCRYCGADVAGLSSNGVSGWTVDPLTRQWKIQCPHCKRLFPSNDFELLYERGLDENGVYDADRARANDAIAVANGEKSALVNVLYPEVSSQKTVVNGGDGKTKVTINNGNGLRPGETTEGWGVDDGWGYRPKDESGNNYKNSAGVIEIHAYIPYYMRSLWTEYYTAIESLANAYIYTDDEKYGRAGAILFDRFADLIREYDVEIQYKKDGTNLIQYPQGYIREHLTDPMQFGAVVIAADALFPMKGDSQVTAFLSQKAQEFGLENTKETGDMVWKNWKDGVLELFDGAKTNRLDSNFGVVQGLMAACAIVVDEEPETTEMIEWLYAPGTNSTATVTGGNILSQLVDDVDRDGMGNESADNYNILWVSNLLDVAKYLESYEGDANYSMWENPKYVQMFLPYAKKVLANTHLAQVGDSGSIAGLGFSGGTSSFLEAFRVLKDNPKTQREAKELAQYIYMREGNSLDELNYGIFVKNPESTETDIRKYVEENPKQKSDMLAGYGFAILRDGGDWKSDAHTTAVNNLRDAWMYFGAAASHSHADNLMLGLEAFGLNIAPDNGYPEATGTDANRRQWHNSTLAHNTVLINEKSSMKDDEANGVPLHFDDADKVKVLDVDGKCSYEEAENYRRTLVMMKANDDVSYTVDFFRVTGGDKHTYSFHSQAENAVPIDGITLTEQKDEQGNWVGTYAYGPDQDGNIIEGVNVPYQDKKGSWTDANGTPYIFKEFGKDPHSSTTWSSNTTYFPRGYTWLQKIRRDKAPEQNIVVEFDVEDYRKTISNTGDIRLRMTQLNTFVPSEVAIVGGLLPRKDENRTLPETFDYVLVHNEKKEGQAKLDTLFTTVFEPYKDSRYIESITPCEVTGAEENDTTVRAVKVTHAGGERIDYIVYSEDNQKQLLVDNLFDFKGFVGVYSVSGDGEVLYKYVNDGSVIGNTVGQKEAYTGIVKDFDRKMEFGDFENCIDVQMPGETVDDALLADLAGKWICIENDGAENAVYKILDAEKLSDTDIRLNTGNVTNIRRYIDSMKPEEGYVYNINEGDTFRIPLSVSEDDSPRFSSIENATTSAGSSLSVTVSASSPLEGKTVSYKATSFPRGASINVESGVITWKPDSSQIGDNHFAVTARDNDGRESTIHFTITVYGSTTGGSSSDKKEETNKTETPSIDNTDTPAGGGGGGGGGAAPTDKTDETTNPDRTDTSDETDNGDASTQPSVGNGGSDVPQFMDLCNHAWAEDAINTLATDEIIKGTTASTFSPASNITRADFALLLVRAFKLESASSENFADVSASDYFAAELAIARNNGIVGGIGENKFAPRNSITRQDMMVIVYRALQNLSVGLGGSDEPNYEDFTTVAPYARDAVSALIGAGLVNGKNGLIAPTDYTTRAEVAVLIKRILDYVKMEDISK